MGNIPAREKAAVPHFVGRYEVLVPIASGGMATVYLARSRGAGGFERDVALKLTHAHLSESPEFQSLLVEEAKLASSIRHHNVVSVLDVGDDPLGLFLIMDYVEGDTLSGLLRRARTANEPMPQRIAMRVLLDALAGLHAAHETKDKAGNPAHIVHRDFSPQNILVGTDGIAKLTDFGIAKAASRVGNTSAGVLKGKVAYMSPEQARGVALDRRADVWAAGVLAWEIIVGRPLWPRETEDVTILIKLVTEPPPRLREMDPTISVALDEAVAKALTMEPADRWPTAVAFAKALLGVVERADAEEVGEYVRASAGPKIEQRREQIRAMGTLRAKMGEISEASEHTPSGNQVRAPPTRVEVSIQPVPSDDDAHEGDATEVVSGIGVAMAEAVPPPGPPPTAEPKVDASSPRPDTTANVRAVGPPRWAVPTVAGAVGVGCLILVIAAIVRHSPTNDTVRPRSPQSVVTTPALPTMEPTSAPTSVVAVTTATATAEPPPPPLPPAIVATAKPPVTATVTATATATAVPIVATATVTAKPTATAHLKQTTLTKLAPSPY